MSESTTQDPGTECSTSDVLSEGSNSANSTGIENASSSQINPSMIDDDGNIVVETGSLQHYVVADNVIIEHIELATGECAETEELIDLVEDCDESEPSVDDWLGYAINSWTVIEKRKLLKAIKLCGIDDYSLIASLVPSKTLEEVSQTMEEFKKTASERLAPTKEQKEQKAPTRGRPTKSRINPLMDWIQMFNDNCTPKELETVTADALRLIAECEHFPSPADTTNVDFKQMYDALASVMEGKPLPDLSSESLEIMRRAISEVSLSANHIKGKGLEHHLQTLNTLRSTLLNQVKESDKKCLLRYSMVNLTSDKQYNPINVPSDLLDPYNSD